MQLVQMNDGAVGVERHGRDALPAEHALRAELRFEHIQVMHAVEHWQDGGVWSDRGFYRLDGSVEIVSLAAEQDQVERFANVFRQHDGRIGYGQIAVRAAHVEARLRELRGAPLAHEKRHVTARIKKPSAKIAANRARTHHQNPHVLLLAFSLIRTPAADAAAPPGFTPARRRTRLPASRLPIPLPSPARLRTASGYTVRRAAATVAARIPGHTGSTGCRPCVCRNERRDQYPSCLRRQRACRARNPDSRAGNALRSRRCPPVRSRRRGNGESWVESFAESFVESFSEAPCGCPVSPGSSESRRT